MILLYGGLMILLALALALFPFLRPSAHARADRGKTVRAIYHNRLKELDAELANGQLTVDTRAEVEQELGATLLEDFAETSIASDLKAESAAEPEQATAPEQRNARWVWLAVAVLLPLASIAIYRSLGDPGAMDLSGAEIVLHLEAEDHSEVLTEWQGVMSRRVAERPKDAQSWYLLGHIELKLANYQRAAEAFAEAHKFHGDDLNIDLYWLQARYLAASGQIDQGTSAIGMRILKSMPNQPLVLEMFAISAFRRDDFKTAVSFLNRALTNSLNPQQRLALSAGFAEARKQLGDLDPSIDVEIRPEAEMPVGATLFVIARPVGGGMPFAVVRRPIEQQPDSAPPLTIRLDDAVTMNPAVGLAQAQEIEVVVRLSRSGAAMAQPGDWEWRSEVIKLADLEKPLHLVAPLHPR